MWQLTLEDTHLRQGEYIVSAGIMQQFETVSNENIVFYCLWDRALSFRIDEAYIGNTPLGLVAVSTSPAIGSSLHAERC